MDHIKVTTRGKMKQKVWYTLLFMARILVYKMNALQLVLKQIGLIVFIYKQMDYFACIILVLKVEFKLTFTDLKTLSTKPMKEILDSLSQFKVYIYSSN